MSEERSIWEVRLGVYATRQQADEIKEQITRILCPDPDHAPPCPVPWSVMTLHESDLDEEDPYPELVEQARIERPGGDGPTIGDR
ncbi:hypothetical protein [Streptomyces sp. NPDC059863]|uniref:hypothetical protein n=1 Tax=unclassified Streptomyces TaxID=2593676 RepID=UPI0036631848